MADQTITCRDCGATFTFTDGEQEFYNSRNLSAPQRCKQCRDARKATKNGPRQMYDATCAQCGQACQVPFEPREGGKPVLCLTCFRATKG